MSKRRPHLRAALPFLTCAVAACAATGTGTDPVQPRPDGPMPESTMPESTTQLLDRTVVPLPGPAPVMSLPPARHFTLTNGLDVLLVEQHELPVVDAQLVVRAGAALDDPSVAGRAALAADMLDEGTAARDALELAEAVDFLGATLSIRPGWDATTVALHVLKPRFEAALALLAEVVTAPSFPADEFGRKKELRLNAILLELDDARALASNAFAAVVYGGLHPYGAPVGGTRASVEALTLAEVRAFYERHVRPGNATLVLAGDVTVEEVRPLLERALGGWEGSAVAPLTLPPAPAHGPTAIYLVDKPGAAQSEIRVGHVGVPRSHPDYFALEVMNTVLGGSFTSRLNMRLREEKGWSYGAGSGFGYRVGPGPFQASTAVHTEVTDSAVAEIVRELRRMREEEVPQEELERARSYLALGYPRAFETTGGIAANMAQLALYGLAPDYHDRYVERIRAVSAADVLRAARTHLADGRAAIVVAGDRATIEAGLRALGLGPVRIQEPAGTR